MKITIHDKGVYFLIDLMWVRATTTGKEIVPIGRTFIPLNPMKGTFIG